MANRKGKKLSENDLKSLDFINIENLARIYQKSVVTDLLEIFFVN